ncbi:MAG: hypothetical protein ACYTDV_01520, partial [Planctomycetota bacterium]
SGNSKTAMIVQGRNSNWAFIVTEWEKIVNWPVTHFALFQSFFWDRRFCASSFPRKRESKIAEALDSASSAE